MGYYWTYYLFTFFMAYAVRSPWICAVIIAFYAARSWLPDPVVILRNLSRMGSLKRQASINPSNVTVRRDLGLAYLDLHRPRKALKYLDEARAKEPRNPDIAYLRGLALLRIKENEEALKALGVAVGIDTERGEPFSEKSSRPGLDHRFRRFGEAYLSAAVALERLGRFSQAEEALLMSARCNSSHVEPLVRLARVRRAQGDARGAREALTDARRTFGELPWFMRRRQLRWDPGAPGVGAWRGTVPPLVGACCATKAAPARRCVRRDHTLSSAEQRGRSDDVSAGQVAGSTQPGRADSGSRPVCGEVTPHAASRRKRHAPCCRSVAAIAGDRTNAPSRSHACLEASAAGFRHGSAAGLRAPRLSRVWVRRRWPGSDERLRGRG